MNSDPATIVRFQTRLQGFGDYNDDVQWTQMNKDYFQNTFTETRLEWITEKEASQEHISGR
jgi:hypothetical protein